jgi:ubiquinol-cytochrome c reductase cytochrome c1 subunit
MPIMKKLLAALLLATAAGGALAAGANITMDTFPQQRLRDTAALQNGARLYVNYCMGCHSASLMRWNRLRDIGLTDEQIREFLIPGDQKVGDMMTSSLSARDGRNWFGKTPPDLSVITRARTSFDYKGTDYLYTLLRGYYRDASTPTGWNNVALANIAMPHIFWELQGPRTATLEQVVHETDPKSGASQSFRQVSTFDPDGQVKVERTPVAGHPASALQFSFKPVDEAQARKFDSEVADLVAFLTFMTDPSAAKRSAYGPWVMLFLLALGGVLWLLNRAYWRNVR